MKKVLIGLLIAAAGTGIYFFISTRKKAAQPTTRYSQEWIIGKWESHRNDSVPDSLFSVQHWEFSKEGIAVFHNQRPALTDSFRFSWKDSLTLSLKKSIEDSTETIFNIVRLQPDSLELKTAESTGIQLTKMK